MLMLLLLPSILTPLVVVWKPGDVKDVLLGPGGMLVGTKRGVEGGIERDGGFVLTTALTLY